jgi:hypothetical protein
MLMGHWTGMTVVMKACKLKAGEEEGLSMYNQRPKIFTFSGDEPVEELKVSIYYILSWCMSYRI